MRPEGRDPAYLWDMLKASRTVRGFLEGSTFHSYSHDRTWFVVTTRIPDLISALEPLLPPAPDDGSN